MALATHSVTKCAGIGLLVATLLFTATAWAQQSSTATSTVTSENHDAFEYGLAAARAGRYERAAEHFIVAARAGDNEEMISRPELRSQRPEVWFNLGLAQSRIRGRETAAIAALRLYLDLEPSATNRDAVVQQILVLEEQLDSDIRSAIERILPTVRPVVGRVGAWQDDGWGRTFAQAYLYLGDSRRAQDILDQYIGTGWRSRRIDDLGAALAMNDAAWAEIWTDEVAQAQPPIAVVGLLAYRAARLIELGDLRRARDTLASVEATFAGLQNKPYEYLDAWEDLACAARDAGQTDMAREITSRMPALIAMDGSEPSMARLWFLLEMGASEEALALARSYRDSTAMMYVRGERTVRRCRNHRHELQGWAIRTSTTMETLTPDPGFGESDVEAIIYHLAQTYRALRGR